MIDDSEIGGLQKGMDTSDVAMTDVTAEVARDFLLSLFDLEGKSDQKALRNADAIIDVQKLTFDVPIRSLQSNITEILTKFVLLSQEGQRRVSSGRCYEFIDVNGVSGCREEDAIEFLLSAFVRCNHELGKATLTDHSKSTIETIKTAILSVFIMIHRGYLDDTLTARRACLVFVRRLLEETISCAFLRSLLEHSVNPELCDEDALDEVFNPIFDVLRSGIQAQHLELQNDEIARDILRVMNTLLTVRLNGNGPRPLCKVLTNRFDFLPTVAEKFKGREFGTMSYLGPFFSYGLVSSGRRPNTRVFINMEDEARKNDGVLMEQTQYQNRMSSIRHGLHQLVHPIAAEASTRNSLMKWMATLISANHMRSRAQYDAAEIVDDHFIANFLSVMYRFTEKIDLGKIQMEYPFLPGTLCDITKETRLKMDEGMAAEFATQFADRPVEYHFSSVCFFLTMAAQKLFYPPLIRSLSDWDRHIKDAKRRRDRYRERLQNTTNAFERSQLEAKAKSEDEMYVSFCRHLLCVKTQLLDPALQASAFDFASKQLKVVMRALCADLNLMGDDSQFPTEPTKTFCAYPEHYLEDVFDFHLFCLQFAPKIVMESSTEWIQQSTVLFTHYEYVKSPFLVSKLVRLLANLNPPLSYNIYNLRISQQRLLNALIKFYSDFEDSGDFYEKYNVRGNIQHMLKWMGDNDMLYKSKFMDMARECGPEFIRFVNMVINDATWCIDESLSGLKGIHVIEKKMANAEEWAATDQELRNQDLGQLEEAKRKVKGWLGTAKSNLELLTSITENSPEPFRTPALGERLAAMLNHNLSQLLGGNRKDFMVKDPDSYGWKPRDFVKLLVNIYLGLNVPAFVKFVAYDERTYTPAFFEDAITQLKQYGILGFSLQERFENMAEDVKKEYESKALLEEEYDDVPEEFKDPIMDAIMEDPVKLPSGHVMDRAVIERHLLSTPNNPFNRAPLTQAELMPDVELKAKIEEWKIQKRNSKK